MSTPTPDSQVVPPPWRLTGSGYILFYRFTRAFVQKRGFIPPSLDGMFLGGLGMVMLVDYAASPVGPYRELLFTPGQFALGRKKHHSITRIVVSSQESVVSGRANWGLPKELADFTVTHENGVDRWQVALAGRTFFDVSLRPGKLSIPVTTLFYKPPIMQPVEDGTLVTRFSVRGTARLADLAQPFVDGTYFPDISTARPIGAVNLKRFTLTFPQPRLGNGH